MGPAQVSSLFDVQIKMETPFRDPVLRGVTTKVKKGELIGVVGKVLTLTFSEMTPA